MDDPELSAISFAFQCYLCLSKTELRLILPDIFENIASVILVYATLGCYIDTLDKRDWAVLSLRISNTTSYQSLLCRSISQQLLDWPELKIGPQWGEKLSRSINVCCQSQTGLDNQIEAMQLWRILCQRGFVASTAEARYNASIELLKITRSTAEALMKFRDKSVGWDKVIPDTMDTLTIVFEFAQRLIDEYGSSDGKTCESVRQDILDAIEPRYYEVGILQCYINLVTVIRFPKLFPFLATFIDFMGADKIPQLRQECGKPLLSLVQRIADGRQDHCLESICSGVALVYASLMPYYASQTDLVTELQDLGESSVIYDGVSKFLEAVSKKDLSHCPNALLQIDRLKALVLRLLPIIIEI